MRNGDFSVDVIARDQDVRELDSGHVLARPGTVYALRLRNLGPLRAVAQIDIDGKPVTAAGLVLDAYSVVTLERPVDANENGRFTVVAEGNEHVFGPDGGRDNPDLGLIEARFRRELPNASRRDGPRPLPSSPSLPFPTTEPPHLPTPGRPMAPPEWRPPGFTASVRESHGEIRSIAAQSVPLEPGHRDRIERAAGTGLTGHSSQEFVPAFVGTLEKEATVIKLRLVIGAEDAIAEARPLHEDDAPARPAARP